MHKPSLKPLGNRVVIRPSAPTTQTASGLYIPDTRVDKPMQGEVIAVGPGKHDASHANHRIPMNVAVGNLVLFNKHAGTEVSSGGETILIMDEDQILAVIES